LNSGARVISDAETDKYLVKRRKFWKFSDNLETGNRDRTRWLTTQSGANSSQPQIPC
jgi:hypothetical protein